MAEHMTTAHAQSPMRDYDAHVSALAEELEYYRPKRFEPRVIRSIRKGTVTFHDLLKAHSSLQRKHSSSGGRRKGNMEMEVRIRALEDTLDNYVKGIAVASLAREQGVDIVIEDGRKERGDYDEFFRIAKKEHGGSLEERIKNLEEDLSNYQLLLDVFTETLIKRGLARRQDLQRRRKDLDKRGSWNGGTIVARAWTDPEFKQGLIEKGREVVQGAGAEERRGRSCAVLSEEVAHDVVRLVHLAARIGVDEIGELVLPAPLRDRLAVLPVRQSRQSDSRRVQPRLRLQRIKRVIDIRRHRRRILPHTGLVIILRHGAPNERGQLRKRLAPIERLIVLSLDPLPLLPMALRTLSPVNHRPRVLRHHARDQYRKK